MSYRRNESQLGISSYTSWLFMSLSTVSDKMARWEKTKPEEPSFIMRAMVEGENQFL